MNDMIIPGEKRQLDFAFTKFWGLKYPVYIESRNYTSAYHGILHNHDYPQFWYCLGGNYLHQIEDQVYKCGKGSLVVIPPGVFHKFRVPEGTEAEIFSLSVMYDTFLDAPIHQYRNAITSLFLPPLSKELGYSCPIFLMLSRESQTAVEAYVSWFSLLNFTQPGAVSETDILDRIEALFSLPEFALPEEHQQNAIELIQNRLYPMMRMVSYLNHHYPEKIVEEELLRTLGICRANRYRYFKGYTGYTCSQYLQMLRIKHVYIYLGHTSYPLSYISDMCGFYDTHHMSHAFKKYAGKSPRNFRLFKQKWLDENPQHKLHIL